MFLWHKTLDKHTVKSSSNQGPIYLYMYTGPCSNIHKNNLVGSKSIFNKAQVVQTTQSHIKPDSSAVYRKQYATSPIRKFTNEHRVWWIIWYSWCFVWTRYSVFYISKVLFLRYLNFVITDEKIRSIIVFPTTQHK